MDLTILFFASLICGLIGAAIGAHKNRGGAGLFFGLLLGPLGWLIIAVGPDHRPAAKPVPAPAPAPVARLSASTTDALLDLKKLLDAGVITQSEFDSKKQTLLARL